MSLIRESENQVSSIDNVTTENLIERHISLKNFIKNKSII